MELDLAAPRPRAELPVGFEWVAWRDRLLDRHARVKFECFAGETDTAVFPSLSRHCGCRDLMHAIVAKSGFCPGATWLARNSEEDVGTVQGLREAGWRGGIQNLGVLSRWRGIGLGRALLLKALEGFAAIGCRRAFLEVTASNEPAVRMYRAIGFRNFKTIYREVNVSNQTVAILDRLPDPVGVGL